MENSAKVVSCKIFKSTSTKERIFQESLSLREDIYIYIFVTRMEITVFEMPGVHQTVPLAPNQLKQELLKRMVFLFFLIMAILEVTHKQLPPPKK